MSQSTEYLHRYQADYPTELTDYLGAQARATIALWGDRDIWLKRKGPLLALHCSAKAPASIVLQVHDLAHQWRTAQVTIISGFHSPTERECLAVLLRGPQPVILCPARGIARMRLKREYKEPMAAGRLLLMSPFGDNVRRMTVDTALTRNRFVAALADTLLIAHAEPGSKTELLAQEVIGWGKPLYTVDNSANDNLVALGVLRYSSAGMAFVR